MQYWKDSDSPYDSRKEAGLEKPEEQAAGNQAAKVLHKGRKGSDQTPGQAKPGDVVRWLEAFDDHVARSFEQLTHVNSRIIPVDLLAYTVCHEQDRDGQLVLVTRETEILLKTV